MPSFVVDVVEPTFAVVVAAAVVEAFVVAVVVAEAAVVILELVVVAALEPSFFGQDLPSYLAHFECY